MSFIEQWRVQVNDSLVDTARLVPFAPDVDLKFELMAVGVLWPVRQPIQDFDVEAMAAVQEVAGENAKHVLRLVQQWDDDPLATARSLAKSPRSKELNSAFNTLIAYFGAFPIFARQLASQAKLAASSPQPQEVQPVEQPAWVFITYELEDGKPLAAEVRQKLEAQNIPLGKDLMSLTGQKDWWQQVTQALTQVDFMVVMMTAAAVNSKTIRSLWRFARQQGVCVLPVTASDNINYAALPRWIRQIHIYNLSLEWPKLVKSLQGDCQMPRIPFMVDDLPEDYVERPAEMETLLSYLFDHHKEESIINNVALFGAGGYGKSTLARALCHNDDIRHVFENGILWVSLGEDPGDLSRHVIDLIEVLSGERPGFTGLDAAVVRLAELLADRDLLLVIDDVWNAAHLKPFLSGGSRCARLITSRNINTLPPDAKIIDIEAMQPREAITLLSSNLAQDHHKEMEQLAHRMGGWPLLLKLTNGALRNQVQKQQGNLSEAIGFINRALDKYGLMVFDHQNALARDQAVSKTIEVSLELLTPAERIRFSELAIFPEDIDIPLATVEKLWQATGNLDDFDTEELCDRLHALALISKLDLTSRHVRLHNVMRAYLVFQHQTRLPDIHASFLDAYAIQAWVDLPLEEPYLWTYLAHHLNQAGRVGQLVDTVKNIAYLVKKIFVKGVYYVESDLALAKSVSPQDGILKLLHRSLSQASHLLAGAKTLDQVANALHSRLVHFAALAPLLGQSENKLPHPLLTARHPLPDLPDPALIRTLWGHASGVLSCQFSADDSAIVSVDKDSMVIVWRAESGEARLNIAGHPTEVWHCAVNTDGSLVALAYKGGQIALWDTQTEAELRRWPAHPDAVTCCALSADGSLLVSASKDKTLKVWDTATGAEKYTLTGHQRTVTSCGLTPDGAIIISASNDGTVKVWNGLTGQEQATYTVRVVSAGIDHLTFMSQRDISYSCAISANGAVIAATTTAGTLTVWERDSGLELLNFTADRRGVSTCALTADGAKVACGLSNNTLKVWDTATGLELLELADHARLVNSCAFSSNGTLIISASDDKTLKLWDTRPQAERETLTAYKLPAQSCAISADGSAAVTAMADKTAIVWDVPAGVQRLALKAHTRKINGCAISLDGSVVVTASQDQTLAVWDAQTGQQRTTLTGHTWAVSGCAISADKATILSASDDSTLKLWNGATGAEKYTLTGHTRTVSNCVISANGYTAVSASGDGMLKVWSPHTGEELATLKGHTAWVNNCAITPDGSLIVSASFDKTLKLWNTRSGKERLTLTGHTSSVTGCALSAEGALVISASRDKSIKVWNARTGACLTTLFVDEPLLDCDCSADATSIIAVGNSGVYFLRLKQ